MIEKQLQIFIQDLFLGRWGRGIPVYSVHNHPQIMDIWNKNKMIWLKCIRLWFLKIRSLHAFDVKVISYKTSNGCQKAKNFPFILLSLPVFLLWLRFSRRVMQNIIFMWIWFHNHVDAICSSNKIFIFSFVWVLILVNIDTHLEWNLLKMITLACPVFKVMISQSVLAMVLYFFCCGYREVKFIFWPRTILGVRTT